MMRLAVFAAIIAIASAQTRSCYQTTFRPTAGQCAGQRINANLCALNSDGRVDLGLKTSAVQDKWSNLDTTFGSCAQRLAQLCSLGGGSPRDLKTGETVLPYCTPYTTCNPGFTMMASMTPPGVSMATSLYCGTDSDCLGPSGTSYQICCKTLKYFITQNCKSLNSFALASTLTGATFCKTNDENCVDMGAAGSLRSATMFTAILALAASAMAFFY